MTLAISQANLEVVPWDTDPVDVADDERTLVDRARDDIEAFAILYRRYVDRVYRFTYRRVGSHHIAEEVTASTFERVLKALPHFTWRGGGFEPWLFRIAANESAAYFRRESRTARPRAHAGLVGLTSQDVGQDDVGRSVEDAEDASRVRKALTTLHPRYQEVISLRYLAGVSTDDAAAAMNCSKAVLSVTLHRATTALQRALADQERNDDL